MRAFRLSSDICPCCGKERDPIEAPITVFKAKLAIVNAAQTVMLSTFVPLHGSTMFLAWLLATFVVWGINIDSFVSWFRHSNVPTRVVCLLAVLAGNATLTLVVAAIVEMAFALF
ncbi:MAG: hypothetical protein KDB27_04135 [Planctomycetales bacterium]|nr:hypothetical protein [Planctomycetales bacterium]